VAHGGAFAEEHNRRRAIRCRNVPPEGLTVVSSRSHRDADAIDAFLASRRVAASSSAGSSLKFCMVASGEADLYPRLGRTMEWDTAAGHALLAAAGGRVTQLDGQELIYGKPEFANPHFVAMGLPA
jgi:3'(2'), 5'-bisphosphate nucleotidase